MLDSTFWRSITYDWDRLRSATPGRRFRDFRRYKLEQVRAGTIRSKALTIGFGILFVMIGLGIGWLPGPGGFLAILGLAALVPFVPGMAYLLDRAEVWVRKCGKAMIPIKRR